MLSIAELRFPGTGLPAQLTPVRRGYKPYKSAPGVGSGAEQTRVVACLSAICIVVAKSFKCYFIRFSFLLIKYFAILPNGIRNLIQKMGYEKIFTAAA